MVDISTERTKLDRVGLCDYRLRPEWGSSFDYTDDRHVDEPATRVFVHISVTNPSNYSSADAHARGIEAIGKSRFPNTGISYNRLIIPGSSKVYEGQPIGRRGAHTVNDYQTSSCTRWGIQCPGYKGPLTAYRWNLNYNSRAYVICQNTWHHVSDAMIDLMARAIAADMLAGFVKMDAKIHGHRCVSAKSCPGDNMWARMHDLEKKVELYLEGGTVLSWNESLEATDLAKSRFPDNYSHRAEHAVMHILGLTYNINFGNIPPNSWMQNLWDIPDEGWSPRIYIRSGYGHSRKAGDNSVKLLEGQANIGARLSAIENLLQQVLNGIDVSVDMDAVKTAAQAGAQDAMAELNVTVTLAATDEDGG